MTMVMTWNQAQTWDPTTGECTCPTDKQPQPRDTRQPATLNERQQILPRTGPMFPPKQTLNVQPRSDGVRTPTINWKQILEDRLAAVRQEVATTTPTAEPTVNRPKSERENILPKVRMTYENPATRKH
jgi:hypothetical protein